MSQRKPLMSNKELNQAAPALVKCVKDTEQVLIQIMRRKIRKSGQALSVEEAQQIAQSEMSRVIQSLNNVVKIFSSEQYTECTAKSRNYFNREAADLFSRAKHPFKEMQGTAEFDKIRMVQALFLKKINKPTQARSIYDSIIKHHESGIKWRALNCYASLLNELGEGSQAEAAITELMHACSLPVGIRPSRQCVDEAIEILEKIHKGKRVSDETSLQEIEDEKTVTLSASRATLFGRSHDREFHNSLAPLNNNVALNKQF